MPFSKRFAVSKDLTTYSLGLVTKESTQGLAGTEGVYSITEDIPAFLRVRYDTH